MPSSIFITGANRGIGLEFVKQLKRLIPAPKHIFATCRNPEAAVELRQISKENPNVHLLKLDVTDLNSFDGVRQEVEQYLEGEGLNLLINNAGIISHHDIQSVAPEIMLQCYQVNTIAPLFLVQTFLPLLQKAASVSSKAFTIESSAIINITSKLGSISDNASGGCYPYRASKRGRPALLPRQQAALNQINKSLSVDLKEHKILAVLLHPGFVLTDMGGPNAPISTTQSVEGMINVMKGLTEEDNGLMYDYAGKLIPW